MMGGNIRLNGVAEGGTSVTVDGTDATANNETRGLMLRDAVVMFAGQKNWKGESGGMFHYFDNPKSRSYDHSTSVGQTWNAKDPWPPSPLVPPPACWVPRSPSAAH